jgi:hypothetical protein
MSVEGLVVIITVLIVAGLWITAPLLGRKSQRLQASSAAQRQHDRLLSHYERLLGNIRDLDEDFATGKIQPADYEQEREQRVQDGIQVLMALDNLDGAAAQSAADGAAIDETVDAAIEAAVSAYRRGAKAN